MRMLLALTVITILAPMAVAKVWTTVYRCDETTPLALVDPNHPGVYRDIMVGTKLVIVISSDTSEYLGGQLRLSWDDEKYASLSGRGYTVGPTGPNYAGSRLEAAGNHAGVYDYVDPRGIGLEFVSDLMDAVPGDWFVVDYHAEQAGSSDVGLYDLLGDPNDPNVPVSTLSFTHVLSRDFNGDGIVNFEDLHLLAQSWHSPINLDPNDPAAKCDLNTDGGVNIRDLALFSEYWLERTDCNGPVTDPK